MLHFVLSQIMRETGFDERKEHEPTIALRKLIEVGNVKGLYRAPVFMNLKYLVVGKKVALHIVTLTDLTDKGYNIRLHQ